MKHKKWPIHIWFLDDDLQKSASYLTNKALMQSINGCAGALVSTYFYFIGIRNKKFYDYFFNKDNVHETMDRFFPNWPLSKKPSFAAYGWKESKWCRMCRENFNYCKSYLSILLDEFSFRDRSGNENSRLLEWIDFDMPNIGLVDARLNEIYLPWKVVDPKFRRVDVVEGYRLQFMSTFEDNDPFKAYSSCPRDIPEFVIKHFRLS